MMSHNHIGFDGDSFLCFRTKTKFAQAFLNDFFDNFWIVIGRPADNDFLFFPHSLTYQSFIYPAKSSSAFFRSFFLLFSEKKAIRILKP